MKDFIISFTYYRCNNTKFVMFEVSFCLRTLETVVKCVQTGDFAYFNLLDIKDIKHDFRNQLFKVYRNVRRQQDNLLNIERVQNKLQNYPKTVAHITRPPQFNKYWVVKPKK